MDSGNFTLEFGNKFRLERAETEVGVGGSKYDPLRDFLRESRQVELVLSLEEIEEVLGFELNESATRPNFWANASSPAGRAQCRAWADAGYDAFFLARERAVRFSARPR